MLRIRTFFSPLTAMISIADNFLFFYVSGVNLWTEDWIITVFKITWNITEFCGHIFVPPE